MSAIRQEQGGQDDDHGEGEAVERRDLGGRGDAQGEEIAEPGGGTEQGGDDDRGPGIAGQSFGEAPFSGRGRTTPMAAHITALRCRSRGSGRPLARAVFRRRS